MQNNFLVQPQEAEIMAPVGSFESLAAAIHAGCDSIYFGVTQLNMRAKAANNMTIDDLKEVAKKCHEHNVTAYLTVNTLLYEHDMVIMRKIIDAAKENGIDAIIASDWAAVQYCREINMPVHFSTQMSISNYEAVKFASQFTNRVVLARELTLDQIQSIAEKIRAEQLMGVEGKLMEIECFVHGALCVAQSGRCYMSLYTYNSSANRGACKQNCRAKYKVTDVDTGKELIIDNEYVMSPEDICTIDFIDKLLEAGIKIFKIEGRGRPPEYVDIVVRTYKKALKDLEEGLYTPERIAGYFEDLKTVYNRGLSDGYYLGKPLGSYSGMHGSKATKEKVHIGKITHYFKNANVVEALVEARELAVGDEVMIIGDTTGVYRAPLTEMRNEAKEPITIARQGDIITFPVTDYIRKNDKLYKFIDRKNHQ